MSYIGKKPVDFNDVTEAQTFTVTGDLTVDTNTLFVDSTNNNVGIGTTSPAISGTTAITLQTKGTASSSVALIASSSNDGGSSVSLYSGQNSSDNPAISYQNDLRFGASSDAGVGSFSEKMRIDSSGNLLVSTTSDFASGTVDGIIAQGTAKPAAAFSNTVDGQIVKFYQGGNLVGSINSRSGVVSSFVFDPRSSGSGLSGGTSQIQPTNENGAVVNNTIDLGSTTTRFKGLYIGDNIAHLDAAGNARVLYERVINTLGNVGTNVTCANLSKAAGSFKIDHPLESKSDTHHLVHSFVEAPQADNIYRGTVDLVGGSATINLDTEVGMTEGTFVALNREVQCFTSNESGWTLVKGSVSGNTLTITAQDNTCTDTISWLVIGERKDAHMLNTDWTDDNGKVIVEPLKPVVNENTENA